MKTKSLTSRIINLMYPSGLGFDNVELARIFYGDEEYLSLCKIRGALSTIRKRGYNVVKRMHSVDGKVQRCKYYIYEGVAENVSTFHGRPPFSCLK